MPNPAADPIQDLTDATDAPPKHRAAGRLAWLAAVACVACCTLPALVAAGLLGGGALAVAAWLPKIAVILAGAAVAVFGWSRWNRSRAAGSGHGCTGSSCGCGTTDGAQATFEVSIRSRP
jgi:mercuric ion transport protein